MSFLEIFIFYIKKEEISLGSINNTNQKSNGNMSKEEFEIVKSIFEYMDTHKSFPVPLTNYQKCRIGCGTMYKGNQIYLYLCYSLCSQLYNH